MTDKETNAPNEQEESKPEKRIKSGKIVSMIFGFAAVLVLVSTLFVPVIQVSGDSMEPMFSNGDIVLLYKTKEYERGDLCCVSWQSKLLLKRVIGLPGDTVEIDEDGNVCVNGQMLDEPYVTDKSKGECDITFPYIVGDDEYFMLGDHRATSIDSRNSAVGCIAKKQVVGQVLTKLRTISPEK